MVVDKIGK